MFPLIVLGLILFIAGIVSVIIRSSIIRKLKQKRFYCFYCGYDITFSSKEGSLLCNSCGNKAVFCNLCSKNVNPNEQIAIIKPCNHIFHKNELLDFVEEENHCPKCKGDLEYDIKNEKLICHTCRLKYGIKDDIPIMLIDEADKF